MLMIKNGMEKNSLLMGAKSTASSIYDFAFQNAFVSADVFCYVIPHLQTLNKSVLRSDDFFAHAESQWTDPLPWLA